MNELGDIWHLNPAVITGAVGAFLAVLAAFGVPITAEQKVAILGFVVPLYLLVGAFVVRKKVTPNRTLEDAGLNPQEVKQAAQDARESANA